jgi:hypothetical protein
MRLILLLAAIYSLIINQSTKGNDSNVKKEKLNQVRQPVKNMTPTDAVGPFYQPLVDFTSNAYTPAYSSNRNQQGFSGFPDFTRSE